MPRAISERRVNHVVDIVAKGRRVYVGKIRPTPTQFVEGSGRPWERNKLRDRLPRASDRESLAALGPLHDLTPVVP
jgi:hypothetical protein